jgi:5-methylcytosine-specific restriction endonuclease McrA
MDCQICGGPVVGRKNKQTCSLVCLREQARQRASTWYYANTEKARIAAKIWKVKNHDKAIASAVKSNKRPERLVWARQHRLLPKVRAKEIEAKRKWRSKNPDKVRIENHKRRSLEAEANGSFTAAEWHLVLWLFNFQCAYCGSTEKITIDHVVPLARGGSNYIENIVPACLSCNCRKHAKLDWQYMKFM